jgi:protein-S-isoprenylcysteine O-methyltransferase Ste14
VTGATGKTGGAVVAYALDHKIPPPIVFAIIAIAMWAVAQLEPAVLIDRTLRLGAAGIFGLSGLAILALGVLAFRKAKTTIDPVRIKSASSVVTGGVFRYTRNPMYVGFTTLLIGWAFYLTDLWTIPGPVVFILFITRFQIIPEERAMSLKFGREYDEYRKRVRRWL